MYKYFYVISYIMSDEEKIKELEEKFFNEILKLQKQIDEIREKLREKDYGL